MTDIFISYAREDEVRIKELVKVLQQEGWSIFWDRRIPAGETWRTYIGKALDEAQCVVVVWTRHSVDSNWVIEEAEDAKRRRVLMPVLFEQIEQPRGFREIQAADLADWQPGRHSASFDQLVYDLQVRLKGAPRQEPEKPLDRISPATATPRTVKKRLMIAVGLIALLAGCYPFIKWIVGRTVVTDSPHNSGESSAVVPVKHGESGNQTQAVPSKTGDLPLPRKDNYSASTISGAEILFGANSQYEKSGFAFAKKAVVSWDSGEADLLVEDSPPAKAHFFLQEDTKDPKLSGSPYDKGAKSGIQRVAAVTLGEVDECPAEGYQYFRFGVEEGAIYCVRTRDGKHFAKIQVAQLGTHSIIFSWEYQVKASRRFT